MPVLALVGEKDLQLAAEPHLSAISGALARGGNDDVTVRGMPGLNHLLQEAESGSPSEFARIEQTVAPAALQLMSGWFAGRSLEVWKGVEVPPSQRPVWHDGPVPV